MGKPEFPGQTSIIVFAKTLNVPAKTRIANSEGQASATKIYRELLAATSASLINLPFHVAYAGSDQPCELLEYFGNAVSLYPQVGEDLGKRMKNACWHCMQMGYLSSIVIGCDCPERTADDIIHAASCLNDGTDVVLGPVEDGGYHLAGVNEKGLRIFDAKKWSTAELMRETLQITEDFMLKTVLLPIRNDIDTIEDYRQWKAHNY